MKRYGDNVTNEDIIEDVPGNLKGEKNYLFMGGCAATYGAFPTPEKPKRITQKKNALVEFLSLLSRKREKEIGSS